MLTMSDCTDIYEGQLSKYTNIVKGWQFRWFILDYGTGFLNYYLTENEKSKDPRGKIHLNSAEISPSDDDSNSFTVKSEAGESYKLRASDARVRQEWVDRLRTVAKNLKRADQGASAEADQATPSTVNDAFNSVTNCLKKTESSCYSLSRKMDELPTSGEFTHVDKDVLMLKATSNSTIHCLHECYSILKQLSIGDEYDPDYSSSPKPDESLQ